MAFEDLNEGQLEKFEKLKKDFLSNLFGQHDPEAEKLWQRSTIPFFRGLDIDATDFGDKRKEIITGALTDYVEEILSNSHISLEEKIQQFRQINKILDLDKNLYTQNDPRFNEAIRKVLKDYFEAVLSSSSAFSLQEKIQAAQQVDKIFVVDQDLHNDICIQFAEIFSRQWIRDFEPSDLLKLAVFASKFQSPELIGHAELAFDPVKRMLFSMQRKEALFSRADQLSKEKELGAKTILSYLAKDGFSDDLSKLVWVVREFRYFPQHQEYLDALQKIVTNLREIAFGESEIPITYLQHASSVACIVDQSSVPNFFEVAERHQRLCKDALFAASLIIRAFGSYVTTQDELLEIKQIWDAFESDMPIVQRSQMRKTFGEATERVAKLFLNDVNDDSQAVSSYFKDNSVDLVALRNCFALFSSQAKECADAERLIENELKIQKQLKEDELKVKEAVEELAKSLGAQLPVSTTLPMSQSSLVLYRSKNQAEQIIKDRIEAAIRNTKEVLNEIVKAVEENRLLTNDKLLLKYLRIETVYLDQNDVQRYLGVMSYIHSRLIAGETDLSIEVKESMRTVCEEILPNDVLIPNLDTRDRLKRWAELLRENPISYTNLLVISGALAGMKMDALNLSEATDIFSLLKSIDRFNDEVICRKANDVLGDQVLSADLLKQPHLSAENYSLINRRLQLLSVSQQFEKRKVFLERSAAHPDVHAVIAQSFEALTDSDLKKIDQLALFEIAAHFGKFSEEEESTHAIRRIAGYFLSTGFSIKEGERPVWETFIVGHGFTRYKNERVESLIERLAETPSISSKARQDLWTRIYQYQLEHIEKRSGSWDAFWAAMPKKEQKVRLYFADLLNWYDSHPEHAIPEKFSEAKQQAIDSCRSQILTENQNAVTAFTQRLMDTWLLSARIAWRPEEIDLFSHQFTKLCRKALHTEDKSAVTNTVEVIRSLKKLGPADEILLKQLENNPEWQRAVDRWVINEVRMTGNLLKIPLDDALAEKVMAIIRNYLNTKDRKELDKESAALGVPQQMELVQHVAGFFNVAGLPFPSGFPEVIALISQQQQLLRRSQLIDFTTGILNILSDINADWNHCLAQYEITNRRSTQDVGKLLRNIVLFDRSSGLARKKNAKELLFAQKVMAIDHAYTRQLLLAYPITEMVIPQKPMSGNVSDTANRQPVSVGAWLNDLLNSMKDTVELAAKEVNQFTQHVLSTNREARDGEWYLQASKKKPAVDNSTLAVELVKSKSFVEAMQPLMTVVTAGVDQRYHEDFLKEVERLFGRSKKSEVSVLDIIDGINRRFETQDISTDNLRCLKLLALIVKDNAEFAYPKTAQDIEGLQSVALKNLDINVAKFEMDEFDAAVSRTISERIDSTTQALTALDESIDALHETPLDKAGEMKIRQLVVKHMLQRRTGGENSNNAQILREAEESFKRELDALEETFIPQDMKLAVRIAGIHFIRDLSVKFPPSVIVMLGHTQTDAIGVIKKAKNVQHRLSYPEDGEGLRVIREIIEPAELNMSSIAKSGQSKLPVDFFFAFMNAFQKGGPSSSDAAKTAYLDAASKKPRLSNDVLAAVFIEKEERVAWLIAHLLENEKSQLNAYDHEIEQLRSGIPEQYHTGLIEVVNDVRAAANVDSVDKLLEEKLNARYGKATSDDFNRLLKLGQFLLTSGGDESLSSSQSDSDKIENARVNALIVQEKARKNLIANVAIRWLNSFDGIVDRLQYEKKLEEQQLAEGFNNILVASGEQQPCILAKMINQSTWPGIEWASHLLANLPVAQEGILESLPEQKYQFKKMNGVIDVLRVHIPVLLQLSPQRESFYVAAINSMIDRVKNNFSAEIRNENWKEPLSPSGDEANDKIHAVLINTLEIIRTVVGYFPTEDEKAPTLIGTAPHFNNMSDLVIWGMELVPRFREAFLFAPINELLNGVRSDITKRREYLADVTVTLEKNFSEQIGEQEKLLLGRLFQEDNNTFVEKLNGLSLQTEDKDIVLAVRAHCGLSDGDVTSETLDDLKQQALEAVVKEAAELKNAANHPESIANTVVDLLILEDEEKQISQFASLMRDTSWSDVETASQLLAKSNKGKDLLGKLDSNLYEQIVVLGQMESNLQKTTKVLLEKIDADNASLCMEILNKSIGRAEKNLAEEQQSNAWREDLRARWKGSPLLQALAYDFIGLVRMNCHSDIGLKIGGKTAMPIRSSFKTLQEAHDWAGQMINWQKEELIFAKVEERLATITVNFTAKFEELKKAIAVLGKDSDDQSVKEQQERAIKAILPQESDIRPEQFDDLRQQALQKAKVNVDELEPVVNQFTLGDRGESSKAPIVTALVNALKIEDKEEQLSQFSKLVNDELWTDVEHPGSLLASEPKGQEYLMELDPELTSSVLGMAESINKLSGMMQLTNEERAHCLAVINRIMERAKRNPLDEQKNSNWMEELKEGPFQRDSVLDAMEYVGTIRTHMLIHVIQATVGIGSMPNLFESIPVAISKTQSWIATDINTLHTRVGVEIVGKISDDWKSEVKKLEDEKKLLMQDFIIGKKKKKTVLEILGNTDDQIFDTKLSQLSFPDADKDKEKIRIMRRVQCTPPSGPVDAEMLNQLKEEAVKKIENKINKINQVLNGFLGKQSIGRDTVTSQQKQLPSRQESKSDSEHGVTVQQLREDITLLKTRLSDNFVNKRIGKQCISLFKAELEEQQGALKQTTDKVEGVLKVIKEKFDDAINAIPEISITDRDQLQAIRRYYKRHPEVELPKDFTSARNRASTGLEEDKKITEAASKLSRVETEKTALPEQSAVSKEKSSLETYEKSVSAFSAEHKAIFDKYVTNGEYVIKKIPPVGGQSVAKLDKFVFEGKDVLILDLKLKKHEVEELPAGKQKALLIVHSDFFEKPSDKEKLESGERMAVGFKPPIDPSQVTTKSRSQSPPAEGHGR